MINFRFSCVWKICCDEWLKVFYCSKCDICCIWPKEFQMPIEYRLKNCNVLWDYSESYFVFDSTALVRAHTHITMVTIVSIESFWCANPTTISHTWSCLVSFSQYIYISNQAASKQHTATSTKPNQIDSHFPNQI